MTTEFNGNSTRSYYTNYARIHAEASQLRADELLRMIHGTAALVRNVVSRLAIWYKRQRLFEELDGLSDYVLADMGMSRDSLRTTVKKSYPYPSATSVAAANDDRDQRQIAA